MFFRKRDKSAAIDKIDFSKIEPRPSYEAKEFYFPYQLEDCLDNAIEKRDFKEIVKIRDVVAKLPAEKASVDPVIDRFLSTCNLSRI